MRPALSRGWPAPGRPCRPHAPTHEAHAPASRVPDGECDGRGSRGAGGRYLSHAEATFRAVDPLAVAVIEPAFRAALMLGGRPPPLEALRGRAADRPTVGLPPPAGPTEEEHRPAPRPAAAQRAPPLGAGAHAGPPRRRRRGRTRRGGTGETDRPAWEDGDARPGGLRSRVHGSRRPRGRASATPWGPACVGVKISARGGGASGHGGRRIPCLPGAHGAGVCSLHRGAAGPDPSRSRPGVAGCGERRGDRGGDTAWWPAPWPLVVTPTHEAHGPERRRVGRWSWIEGAQGKVHPSRPGGDAHIMVSGPRGRRRRAARWSRRSRLPSTRSGRRRHHRPVSRAAVRAASAFASRCGASASATPLPPGTAGVAADATRARPVLAWVHGPSRRGLHGPPPVAPTSAAWRAAVRRAPDPRPARPGAGPAQARRRGGGPR